tara:strand:- start:611 stop:1123 length:513 start_codon:yes stop_codon:yes gene_type:complete
MKLLKNFFLRKNPKVHDEVSTNGMSSIDKTFDQYDKISKLLKEARIQKNLTIEELSNMTKIPEYTLNSIENNIEQTRPKYPFIRSILLKLEVCLSLRKNTLVGLLKRDIKNIRRDKRKFIIRKFDFLNTWEGVLIYFLILILNLFILKRYFLLNEPIIDLKSVQEKIYEK